MHISCTGLLLAVAVAAALGGEADAQVGPKDFKITTGKPTDAVKVLTGKESVVFNVHSPAGISEASIARESASWPKQVVLRLHLKGLEDFKVGNGKVTIHAAVTAQQGKPKVRQWKDGKEDAPLDSKSPYWIGIRMQREDGKAAEAIPLKDGFFEMPLPAALFEGNPKAIVINWIDFFRG